MSYAFDPELTPWLPLLPTSDLAGEGPIKARGSLDVLLAKAPPFEPPAGLEITDQTVPGLPGAPRVAVRIYTPTDRPGPLPGLLYLHGGGFVSGSVEAEHRLAADTAVSVGVVVASVEYRLAPEHPYPAPLEDCYAALLWLAGKAVELGVDPDRIGVGGESAGGGLAAAVALLARDRGGPSLCFQYLGIPELDDRLDTPSMKVFVDTPMWNRPNAETSWAWYLGGEAGEPLRPGAPDVPAHAAPARAQDLSGLPPAYVSVCEFDPLRDEGIIYAQRLIQAGVSTELHLYPGTFHASIIAFTAAVSRRMMADRRVALVRGLRAAT
ncbi:alpha/beta hydrolase [Frankia sp. AgB1.9]|uniref:alpha/beta hydrolase n=1 Tax=unclassified Frankia TaxID=2632575 RepID=UPI001933EE9A|nr:MULTISPECIES: alpha/beta hydrolase [unclassified Frankia]MBL7489430.1 alpha/beta hydrolase [Frankia sp. AgW1.1]MBL7550635.1 alpha/beta hydrolase [Frankia sp. AgB1.9]MBL7620990.1 alpha/beta hydrolase [Frankia sp. AgB1.8]